MVIEISAKSPTDFILVHMQSQTILWFQLLLNVDKGISSTEELFQIFLPNLRKNMPVKAMLSAHTNFVSKYY